LSEYLNMGGYAGFVWPAWGIALVVLGGLIAITLRTMRARERELAELEAEAPRRRRRREQGPNAPEDA